MAFTPESRFRDWEQGPPQSGSPIHIPLPASWKVAFSSEKATRRHGIRCTAMGEPLYRLDKMLFGINCQFFQTNLLLSENSGFSLYRNETIARLA
jgi:hypothetical protein